MTKKRNSSPKREPLSRLWFLARGFKQADPAYTNGCTVWLHPETNDVLGPYGQKLPLKVVPYKKYRANSTQYLILTGWYGDMYLARLKYLTFKGEIKPGYSIDHIDGNTFNNNINNLRAVPREINDRDGGFLRKLRNKGIPTGYPPCIMLAYYERMTVVKEKITEWRYAHLTREDLLGILKEAASQFGFTIVDPRTAIAEERNKYCDMFIERD